MSLAYPAHIRAPEKNEKCAFCEKPHFDWIQVVDNSGRYTTISLILYCEDHKDAAIAKKAASKQTRREGRGDEWD